MTDKERIAYLERENLALRQRRAFAEMDAWGDCERADSVHIPGCGPDDEFDSKGRPLRPRVNDAGEPWWM
jgi:hypothetical protein